jgi:hypothetical protein
MEPQKGASPTIIRRRSGSEAGNSTFLYPFLTEWALGALPPQYPRRKRIRVP